MLKQFEDKMQKSLDSMANDFMTIRAGRANPHVLDKVKVDYYGVATPVAQDGKAIRLNFPDLTEERRKELAKDVKKRGEEAKVAVRNIRRDANDFVKKQNKAGDLNDDQAKDEEDKVQKMTDKYIKQIDEAVDAKSKEIMTV